MREGVGVTRGGGDARRTGVTRRGMGRNDARGGAGTPSPAAPLDSCLRRNDATGAMAGRSRGGVVFGVEMGFLVGVVVGWLVVFLLALGCGRRCEVAFLGRPF